MNWPQWRGPSGTGYSAQASPPTRWNDSENVRWKTPIPGRGHSTPVVHEDLLFLTTAIPAGEPLPPKMSGRPGEHDNLPVDHKHQFVVLAIDRANGTIRWQRVVHEAVPIEGGHKSASLASASPIVDEGRVYAFFGSHGLYCLDFEGTLIWERQFGQMHSKHGHGEGASPVLHGQAIVVNWDHEEQSFVTALNKTTGETIWRNERPEVTSWSSPIIVEHGNRPQVIVAGTERVRSYDLETGDEVWQCGGMSANIVATPVFSNGVLVVGSSYEIRNMLAIKLDGAQGDITGSDNVLWTRTRGTPYVPSLLLVNDGVYFLAHYQNILTRVDLTTGEESPGAMRLGELTSIYASPVAAGEFVYITDLEGTTMVITTGPTPRVVAVNRLNEHVNASAAIADNSLFIRGEKHLFCITET
ncbi:MAG: PQQ-binding-like beta-propeller repeat protein [Pirellulaceae bacterium]